jgi:tetratricopeptide (TPR) repeat protein
MGAVAEAFGLAFADARDLDKAIDWYRSAVAAADGSASFKAAEQLGNQLARRGEANLDLAQGRRDVEEAIDQLQRLVDLHPTAERESLLGSAYKRLVMIEGRVASGGVGRGKSRRRAATRNVPDERLAALKAMALHYGNAERLARQSGAFDLFYPAKNGISAELRLGFLERRPAEIAIDRIEAVRESLDRAATERPDFWSAVGQIELRVLTALGAQQLAPVAPPLIDALRDLKGRVPAPGMWDSVYSEARFTLEPYQALADAAEKKAAATLLAALKVMAAA